MMNQSNRFAQTYMSTEVTLIAVYCSALLGASLAEMEVCRVGLWGCQPLRGAWIVHTRAAPMLAILALTPMKKRLLATVSATIGIILFLAGFQSAHSEGSLTWAAHNFYLPLFGSAAAIVLKVFLTLRNDTSMPLSTNLPQIPSDDTNNQLRLLSLKDKMIYLYAGALAGGALGQILIYGSVNDRSTFVYDTISFDDIPFLLVRIVGGAATPIIILLSQMTMGRAKTIRCTVVVATLAFGLTVIYGQYDSQFGHDALGYYGLWFAILLAALVALTVHKHNHSMPSRVV